MAALAGVALNPPAATALRHGTNLRQAQLFSLNWAGYAAASDFTNPEAAVTAVHGSWIVPAVRPTNRAEFSSAWVGIGGFFSGDVSLIQTGTEQDSSHGATFYSAWLETLPQAATPITNTMTSCPTATDGRTCRVQPGDHVTASVVLTDTAKNGWTITLTDTTATWTFSTTLTYASSKLSAEWIVERPALCSPGSCTLTKLAHFSAVFLGMDYTGMAGTNSATIGASSSAVGSLPNQEVAMVSGNSIIAQPSAISNDGTSFTVVRQGK